MPPSIATPTPRLVAGERDEITVRSPDSALTRRFGFEQPPVSDGELGLEGGWSSRVRRGGQTKLRVALQRCSTSSSMYTVIEDQMGNYERRDEAAVEAMDGLKQLTYEMKDTLVQGKLDRFGVLLHEAWLNKKEMAGQISNPHIDELYDEARRHGALGGKISGAGGGGFMFFYCPGETRHAVTDRLDEMGVQATRFAFESAGAQTWQALAD